MTELNDCIFIDIGSAVTKITSLTTQPNIIKVQSNLNEFSELESKKITQNTEIGNTDNNKIFSEDGIPILNNLIPFLRLILKKIQFNSETDRILISTAKKIPRDMKNKIISEISKITYISVDKIVLKTSSTFLLYYNNNFNDGLIIDIGYNDLSVIPFENKKILSRLISNSSLGSRNIIDFMKNLLERQFTFIGSPLFDDFIQKIIAEKCFLEIDFENKLKDKKYYKGISETIILPHLKNKIKLSSEKFIAPELLFNPKLANFKSKSLLDTIMDSLKLTPASSRSKIFKNIIINGGIAQIPNFKEKIEDEFQKIPLLKESIILIDQNPELSVIKGMINFYENSLSEK